MGQEVGPQAVVERQPGFGGGARPPESHEVVSTGGGDLPRAAGGALEAHVLQEMTDAVLGRPLVPGTRAGQKRRGGGTHARQDLTDDAQTVGQGMFDEG